MGSSILGGVVCVFLGQVGSETWSRLVPTTQNPSSKKIKPFFHHFTSRELLTHHPRAVFWWSCLLPLQQPGFGCSFCCCSCLYYTNKNHLPEPEYSRRSCTPRGCTFVWLWRNGKRVENEQLLLCLFKKSPGFALTFLQLGEGLGQGQCIFHWDLVDKQRGKP